MEQVLFCLLPLAEMGFRPPQADKNHILNTSVSIMIPTQYSPKVDHHIYGISGGCESVDDWIGLAVAALDQAGLSVQAQKIIRGSIVVEVGAEDLWDKESARKAKE